MSHYLVEYAESQQNNIQQEPLCSDPKENEFLSPNGQYPHAFVLASLMDQQVKSEIAWQVPIKINRKLNRFSMVDLLLKSEKEWEEIFQQISNHRFPKKMARFFYKAIHLIHEKYDDNARKIWEESPSSGKVICRFLEFDGMGMKIATMAANILVRQFNVPLKDKCCLDASPDVLVKRVLRRNKLILTNKPEEVLYIARALNPDYPGIIDLPCWHIGRKFCHEGVGKMDCKRCPLNEKCPKENN